MKAGKQRIEKDVGLSGFIEVVMGKMVVPREEFRKQVTFYHRLKGFVA